MRENTLHPAWCRWTAAAAAAADSCCPLQVFQRAIMGQTILKYVNS